MKNPLERKDHTTLIVALAAGAVVAGALAYLFLTDDGHETLDSLTHKIKDTAKDLTAGVISDKTGVSKKTVKTVTDRIVK